MRIKSTLLTLGAVLVIGVSPVLAGNPHFISASGYESGGTLYVDFKIAGLGNSVTDTITLSGHVTADWYCTNRGGNNPPGLYRTDEDVTVSGTHTSGRNGQIEASITASPTPALCPNGMASTTLVSATWSNAELDDSYGANTTVE